MNKTLKFENHLSEMIRQGKKTTTWRLFDDKNLTAGDVVDLLIFETKEKFATAKLTEVIEKDFAHLEESDWEGHEKFASNQMMYENYTRMYSRPVDSNSKLKIIKFELIK